MPVKEDTFHPKFKKFEVKNPEKVDIFIRHYFRLPPLNNRNLGEKVYEKPPWQIYKKDDAWIYAGISPIKDDVYRIAVFNHNYTRARIYNRDKEIFLKGNLHSLTLFPTDQILLAQILADKDGCIFHSCGINFEGKGFLFAGHSGSGKSTIANMLKEKAEILCDDRIIVRNQKSGFKIYGTWSHGDVPDVSVSSAGLRAILFLEKAGENRVIPLNDKGKITKRLLSCLIKPFVTVDWWEKTLSLVDKIASEIPCYRLRFDKSGGVVDLLRQL